MLITDEARLGEVWPEASRALRGYLRARGSSLQDAEDVLQECAVRVLHARPTFVDAADLVRWCIPVVRNLTVDLYRRESRETLVDRLPDGPTRGDLADDVSHSLELGRVLRALQQLRPADREAIVSHVHQDASTQLDRKSAIRLNVRRHRARQRLLARLAGLLAAGWACVRRAARVSGPAMLPAALALSVVATSVAGLTPGVGAGGLDATSRTAGSVRPSTAQAPTAGLRMVAPRTAPSASRQLRPASAQSVDVAAARVPTGEGAVLRRHRRAAAAPIVCVRDVAAVGTVCVGAPTSRRAHATSGPSLAP